MSDLSPRACVVPFEETTHAASIVDHIVDFPRIADLPQDHLPCRFALRVADDRNMAVSAIRLAGDMSRFQADPVGCSSVQSPPEGY